MMKQSVKLPCGQVAVNEIERFEVAHAGSDLPGDKNQTSHAAKKNKKIDDSLR